MVSRTQQPDHARSDSSGSTRTPCRTFRVDRYSLGLDVPLTDRFVSVALVRDDSGGVRVRVDDDDVEWVVRVVDGEVEESWRGDCAGEQAVLGRVPRWVLVVLDHVGVIA